MSFKNYVKIKIVKIASVLTRQPDKPLSRTMTAPRAASSDAASVLKSPFPGQVSVAETGLKRRRTLGIVSVRQGEEETATFHYDAGLFGIYIYIYIYIYISIYTRNPEQRWMVLTGTCTKQQRPSIVDVVAHPLVLVGSFSLSRCRDRRECPRNLLFHRLSGGATTIRESCCSDTASGEKRVDAPSRRLKNKS